MKQKNISFDDLKMLSKAVYQLKSDDSTSRDFVYSRIIRYLAEHGSFTIPQLAKEMEIERRKLKNKVEELIVFNYVRKIPEWKYRGGKQEYTYYLTEKGVMASIGLIRSYNGNINIKKTLQFYKGFGKRYQKFIQEFIKSQIQVYLAYHYVQGISLRYKREHSSEYDKFRQIITKPFEIRIINKNLEEQFNKVLEKFNQYKAVHMELFREKEAFVMLWQEPLYIKNGIDTTHGFHGWYNIQFLTGLGENLKPRKYNIRKNQTRDKKSNKGPTVKLVSEPEFLYSLFEKTTNDISSETVENTMKSLGLKQQKARTNLQRRFFDDPYNDYQ